MAGAGRVSPGFDVRRHGAALALAVAGALLIGIVAWDSVRLLDRPFPGFLVWDNGVLVSFHRASWTGPQSGLPLNGGRVVAVAGQPFRGGAALQRTVAAAPAGTPVEYRVAWAGEEQGYRVPSMTLRGLDHAATFGIYLLNAVSFLLVAILALWLRPDLREARSLALACVFMGALLGLTIDYFIGYRFVRGYQILEALTPVALAQFALLFPLVRLGSRRRWGLLAAFGLLCLAIGLSNAAWFYSRPEAARRATYAVYLLIACIGLGTVTSFAEVLLRARSPRARAQAAAVFAGGFAAIVLPALMVLVFFLLGWVISFSWVTALLPIFPLAILYAVVRHDLLGVTRFARLTLGYTAATAAVVGTYAAALLLLDRLLEQGTSPGPAASFALLIAIALAFDPLRRRIQRQVDRLFFRSSVNVADVLEATSADLAGLAEEEAIARTVEERLEAALKVEHASLSFGDGSAATGVLAEPVIFQDEQLGTLACGEKRSGAPFSDAEHDLVKGLASQVALALRNARSIRELQETQLRLLRSERLAAIGELAGAVAHGIRNPLSGIRVTAQVSLEESPDGEQSPAMSDILKEADRLDQRVSTLLDFSRPFEPRPRQTDLGELLHAVRQAVVRNAERREVDVALSLPDEPLRVRIDPDYLEEALLELTSNALRATPAGGRVTLELRREGDLASLRVVDDGPGIPDGVRGQVFDLFFTTRSDGTGMGLATVKKLVEAQGGRVSLERSCSRGTSFRIDLPSADAPS